MVIEDVVALAGLGWDFAWVKTMDVAVAEVEIAIEYHLVRERDLTEVILFVIDFHFPFCY